MMSNDGNSTKKDLGTRKSPVQLQYLEKLFSENNYPKHDEMEDYATYLKLTYCQIRTWFVERRRRERKKKKICGSSRECIGTSQAQVYKRRNCYHIGHERNSKSRCTEEEALGLEESEVYQSQDSMGIISDDWELRTKDKMPFTRNHSISNKSDYDFLGQKRRWSMMENNDHNQLPWTQSLFSKDYILKRIFRKDGPPLGVEFDSLPANAFSSREASRNHHFSHESQRLAKRRKILESPTVKTLQRKFSAKTHGIGKGLMTVWHATLAKHGKLPTSGKAPWMLFKTMPKEMSSCSSKRLKSKKVDPKLRASLKLQEKSKPAKMKRKVPCSKEKSLRSKPIRECKLATDNINLSERRSELLALVDDEEMELRELQEGPNPLRCSAHITSNGQHGCPFCKDLLAKFPPQAVKMRQPFSMRPWDSSVELVKKLFKVIRFLYTYATIIEVCPFSLDEFAQSFHDKDSLLLGKIHVALLKIFLVDVQKEISTGFIPRASKDCRFLSFVHFERNQMVKYGLSPRTLKGELFGILLEKGSNGIKVSELAKSSQIAELGLPDVAQDLEELISYTLASDITLFEKIGFSTYRLRVDPHIKGRAKSRFDDEDSGSVDDESDNASTGTGNERLDDEIDSAGCGKRIIKHKTSHKNKLTGYTEIDESFSGESWVLGLMEGEYCNLSIEEKLDVLVGLIDLAGAGSSFRIEEPVSAVQENNPDKRFSRPGGKIKKSLPSQHEVCGPLPELPAHGSSAVMDSSLVDSSVFAAKVSTVQQVGNKFGVDREVDPERVHEGFTDAHPLQSIYLGSDRRYNGYWLLLGPCSSDDPGHRRVYVESSEDGHWEVIDTAQALRSLMSVLDCRGQRESYLFASLENREAFLCQAMDNYFTAKTGTILAKEADAFEGDSNSGDAFSPISDIDNNPFHSEPSSCHSPALGAVVLRKGKSMEEKKQRWGRLQAFDKWIWTSFYSTLGAVRYSRRSFMESLARCENCHDLYWRDEKHCRICHATFEVDFDLEERYALHVATCREAEDCGVFPKHKVLPSQLQALKAAIYAIEMAMPEGALIGAWSKSGHKLWVKRLRRTASLPELLQVLTDLINAINQEWFYESASSVNSSVVFDDVLIYFQTMPQTLSAVALWMVKLDAFISPYTERRHSRCLQDPQLKEKRR